MEFFTQEYWSRFPFPIPGHLPDAGTELTSLASPALGGGFFTTAQPRKPLSVETWQHMDVWDTFLLFLAI